MKIKLPASIASPEDLQAVVLELKEYVKWSAHVAVRQKALKHKGHSGTASADHAAKQPVLSPAAKALIHDRSDSTPLTDTSLDELIAEIELLTGSAPRITITLAGPPHGSLKKTLVGWCRENIHDNILVSFLFNRTLLGGMVVRSGSRIFDWSTRRSLLEHRSSFPHIFHKLAGPLEPSNSDSEVADNVLAAIDQALQQAQAAEPGPLAERGA